MPLRIVFKEPRAAAQWVGAMNATLNGIARASSRATREAAVLIRQRGQGDIQRAGLFGARWTEGLQVVADPATGNAINNTITITHSVVGAETFEFGGVHVGRPLMWVPLSFANVKKGQRAKNFPGGLFRVTSKNGKPLLLSKLDKKPKFVGLSRVKIPQKFHLRDIAQNTMANDFPQLYQKNMDVNNG